MTDLSIGKVAELLELPVHTVRRLTDSGVLRSHTSQGGHRRYEPSEVIHDYQKYSSDWEPPVAFERTYSLAGLAEDQVWSEVLPVISTSEHARHILAYAFTEMVNNAIDHSRGHSVQVRVRQTPERTTVEIQDDGIGAFENVRSTWKLADLYQAIQEINKGKASTDPRRHTGEGIFFSSKAVDRFVLDANGLAWIVDNRLADMTIQPGTHSGTYVRLEVDANTARRLREVFDEYTRDYAFVRTRPVVKLYETGIELISRSEAKRLGVRLDEFDSVVLDFEGVQSVGQGFVDELFGVWSAEHPEVELEPVNMTADVEFMVRRGLSRRAH